MSRGRCDRPPSREPCRGAAHWPSAARREQCNPLRRPFQAPRRLRSPRRGPCPALQPPPPRSHPHHPAWPSARAGLPGVARTPAARRGCGATRTARSEEHTSELQSLAYLVCRLLLEKKKKHQTVSDDQVIVQHASQEI